MKRYRCNQRFVNVKPFAESEYVRQNNTHVMTHANGKCGTTEEGSGIHESSTDINYSESSSKETTVTVNIERLRDSRSRRDGTHVGQVMTEETIITLPGDQYENVLHEVEAQKREENALRERMHKQQLELQDREREKAMTEKSDIAVKKTQLNERLKRLYRQYQEAVFTVGFVDNCFYLTGSSSGDASRKVKHQLLTNNSSFTCFLVVLGGSKKGVQ